MRLKINKRRQRIIMEIAGQRVGSFVSRIIMEIPGQRVVNEANTDNLIFEDINNRRALVEE